MRMRPVDNPFRSVAMDALPYRFVDDSEAALWSRLEAVRHRGLIVGPMGTGKTTLCHLLQRGYEARGRPVLRTRLYAGQRQPPRELLARLRAELTAEHVLIMDGIEQLSALGWWRLQRAVPPAAGLVATSHGPGRLPEVYRTRTTPELLETLTRDLLPASIDLPAGRTAALFRTHDGNIRECLRSLYGDFSGRSLSA